ncbi:helix-turn-helix domain-containing protein [Scatolibacter rhodanostii]|uniref:helix-turn-helix domain-containing protein n=1 Tax=Scatolibacter rhodanostii TaxID=2014781 RepID=UPI000C088BC1|nr:helix-turn-helix domain-containing protein [Scatolibacter rhodanostii]
MDCSKVGNLIFKLRKERHMTQKQLAHQLNISDKTISKWECGLGCPDVSLLPQLSQALQVNIEKILLGDLNQNRVDGGNMKRIKFYVCPDCGNVITATAETEVSCCGRKLTALTPKPSDEEHNLQFESIENDHYITFTHPMNKEHYLQFVACVTYDKVLLVRLYPEQGAEVRIPKLSGGKFYFACSQHGLWVQK